MGDTVRPSILKNLDAQVACIIAESRAISKKDGLRLFLGSTTHKMLLDDILKQRYFSPLVLFDMWENEIATGDPTNSLCLRGDEVGQEFAFFAYLLESYAAHKGTEAGGILEKLDEKSLTDYVYGMYEMHHSEHIGNAFADIDSILEIGQPAW